MKTWNLIESKEELDGLTPSDFEKIGMITHPTTYQPHGVVKHKVSGEWYLLPMEVAKPT